MCVEKFQLPKTITWIDTMNIFRTDGENAAFTHDGGGEAL